MSLSDGGATAMTIGIWLSLILAVAPPPPGSDGPTREPRYKGKPSYGVLSFDADGKERIWMARDGDTLHVDRNGNGDLTDPGEAIVLNRKANLSAFSVGGVKVAGKTHVEIRIEVTSEQTEKEGPREFYSLSCEVARTDIKSRAPDGRVPFVTSKFAFSARPGNAPEVCFGGPLELRFMGGPPTLRPGRDQELTLVAGTRGKGSNLFAMLAYEGVIPSGSNPVLELSYEPNRSGEKPIKELFELKKRC
jgi:hypothetical protein